jgi:hypothetical protein
VVTRMKARLTLFCAALVLSACNAVLGDFPADAELRCEDRGLALEAPGQLVFAMRNVQYVADKEAADAEPIGFDLDLGATCAPPPWAVPASDSRPVDNAFGAAAARIGGVSVNDINNEMAERGDVNTLFSIRGYNGQANDPEIEIAVFGASMGDRDWQDHEPPRWDGSDTWYATSVYVTGDVCPTPLVRARGTVTSWTVDTAVFPGVPDANAMRFRATLAKGDNGWSMRNAVMGSLWKIDDLFVVLGNGGPQYCTGEVGYPLYRQIYCESVDMDADSDGVCDALSVGSRFEAYPARFGGVREYQNNACSPEENPATYGCDGEPSR